MKPSMVSNYTEQLRSTLNIATSRNILKVTILSLSQAQLVYRAQLGLAWLELDNDLLSLAQKLKKIELKKGFWDWF